MRVSTAIGAVILTAACSAARAAPPLPPPTALDEIVTFLVRRSVPEQYEDDDDWGGEKEVVSGLKVRLDGIHLRTKRRRKDVNHGTWKRYRLRLRKPEEKFRVQIANTRRLDDGRMAFDLSAVADLGVYGRLQQWQYGVRLASISASADARVRLRVSCAAKMEADYTKAPPDFVLRPEAVAADLDLIDFELHRVSHLSGDLAEELGRGVRDIVEEKLEDQRPKLVAKINRQLDKHQDRLRLSVSDLLHEALDKHQAEESDAAPPALVPPGNAE